MKKIIRMSCFKVFVISSLGLFCATSVVAENAACRCDAEPKLGDLTEANLIQCKKDIQAQLSKSPEDVRCINVAYGVDRVLTRKLRDANAHLVHIDRYLGGDQSPSDIRLANNLRQAKVAQILRLTGALEINNVNAHLLSREMHLCKNRDLALDSRSFSDEELISCYRNLGLEKSDINDQYRFEYALSERARSHKYNYIYSKHIQAQSDDPDEIDEMKRIALLSKVGYKRIYNVIPISADLSGRNPKIIGFHDIDRLFFKFIVGYEISDMRNPKTNNIPRTGVLGYGQYERLHFSGRILVKGVVDEEESSTCVENCNKFVDPSAESSVNMFVPMHIFRRKIGKVFIIPGPVAVSRAIYNISTDAATLQNRLGLKLAVSPEYYVSVIAKPSQKISNIELELSYPVTALSKKGRVFLGGKATNTFLKTWVTWDFDITGIVNGLVDES
jgi:hypothetical protein